MSTPRNRQSVERENERLGDLLLDKIGDWSVRLSQDPGDWAPEHRLWWETQLDAVIAAECRATVERIRVRIEAEVAAILDEEAARG